MLRRLGLATAVLGTLLLAAVAVLVIVATPRHSVGDVVRAGVLESSGVLFTAVGAFLLLRRRGQVIGPLLMAFGISSTLANFLSSQSHRYLAGGGAFPHQRVLTWGDNWASAIAETAVLPVLLLVFPDGRLQSRRWRIAVWIALGAAVIGATGHALAPGPMENHPDVTNPFGVRPPLGNLFTAFVNIGWIGFALTVVLVVISLRLRMRDANGDERQQLKWMFFAGGLLALSVLGFFVGPQSVAGVANAVALCAVPVAIGVAVMRYRLYDVDRVISRTVAYLLLSVLLAGIFIATVGVLARLTPTDSQIGIAAGTLVTAAVFNPLRIRLQVALDRRFNRARYDAAGTVERFARGLNVAISVDSVRAELGTAVATTLEPAALSVWLRDPGF
jgi:hypothetical protein